MEITRKVKLIFFAIFFVISSSNASNSSTWVGSKYQIECTMCAACDNPCSQYYSPPPPVPSPPPPSPPPPASLPPPSTSSNCPPPPSSGGGGSYYYSPPPPYQPGYGSYPPPQPPSGDYPSPTPPNPIMPYFPWYYHSPPPRSMAVKQSISFSITLLMPLIGAVAFLL